MRGRRMMMAASIERADALPQWPRSSSATQAATATGHSGSPRSWKRSGMRRTSTNGRSKAVAIFMRGWSSATTPPTTCFASYPDDYLKAPYSTLERNAALWQAAGKRPGFVLLIAVKPCRLPTLADHIRRCEIFGVPEDVARLRFHEFMQKREAPAAVAFPGKVFAVSNIPIRVPEHFLGREDSLAVIETALGRTVGRVAISSLHGLRGVGKTTLAAAYAERHRGDYRATWWIRAQTESTMRADLVALGVRLNWIAADDKEEPALATVMERLRHEGEGILLIYDNAIDQALSAARWVGSGSGHVERTRLARDGIAGRDQTLAEGDRRRLFYPADGACGGAPSGRSPVRYARRLAARSRAGGGLLRTA